MTHIPGGLNITLFGLNLFELENSQMIEKISSRYKTMPFELFVIDVVNLNIDTSQICDRRNQSFHHFMSTL